MLANIARCFNPLSKQTDSTPVVIFTYDPGEDCARERLTVADINRAYTDPSVRDEPLISGVNKAIEELQKDVHGDRCTLSDRKIYQELLDGLTPETLREMRRIFVRSSHDRKGSGIFSDNFVMKLQRDQNKNSSTQQGEVLTLGNRKSSQPFPYATDNSL